MSRAVTLHIFCYNASGLLTLKTVDTLCLVYSNLKANIIISKVGSLMDFNLLGTDLMYILVLFLKFFFRFRISSNNVGKNYAESRSVHLHAQKLGRKNNGGAVQERPVLPQHPRGRALVLHLLHELQGRQALREGRLQNGSTGGPGV